jgi:toxin ParE1/3/4
MRRVVFSDRATDDLDDILAYIATEAGYRLALRTIDHLERAALELADTALSFPLLVEREDAGIRRRVVRSYNIFYVVDGDTVKVLHFLHGARDHARILFPEA